MTKAIKNRGHLSTFFSYSIQLGVFEWKISKILDSDLMILSMFTWVWDHWYRYGYNAMGMGTGTSSACQESRVRVRDQVHGYRYKLPYPDKYMGTGMGKGTTSLLSWALYNCNSKIWLQVCPWKKALQNQFLSGIGNTSTPVVHTNWCWRKTLILYIQQLGGVKKVFTLVEGGSKSFGGLQRGVVKKFDEENFHLPSPPPKYLWTLPKINNK